MVTRMSEFSSPVHRKRLRPKAYSIGLYIVGGFILLEIVALLFIFWIRQEVRIETAGPALSSKSDAVSFLDLDDEASLAEVPLPNLPKPEIEARLDLDLKNTPQLDIARLNEDARKFRRDGDFHLAEAALRQALEIDKENVLTLTNLAMLEEARGDGERSLAAWREVIRAGTQDGEAVSTTVQLARERARLIARRIELEQSAVARESSLSDSKRILSVDQVLTEPANPGENPSELKKEFIIRKKDGVGKIASNRVKIQLYFYERTPENRLAPAPIDARFAGNPARWDEDGAAERLVAEYRQSTASGEDRRYYGYLIRIFYEGELQDERAEPEQLLRLFAPE